MHASIQSSIHPSANAVHLQQTKQTLCAHYIPSMVRSTHIDTTSVLVYMYKFDMFMYARGIGLSDGSVIIDVSNWLNNQSVGLLGCEV